MINLLIALKLFNLVISSKLIEETLCLLFLERLNNHFLLLMTKISDLRENHKDKPQSYLTKKVKKQKIRKKKKQTKKSKELKTLIFQFIKEYLKE